MASKQLPIVAEAFLGSEPFVAKCVKITFGSSGYSGTNDVDMTTAGDQDLLTFADSGFVITDIAYRVVEAFSAAFVTLGVDSDPDAIAADSDAGNAAFTVTTAGNMMSARYDLSSAAGVGAGKPTSTDYAFFAGAWPADSDDSLVAGATGHSTLGTEGHLEVYVWYHEID